MKKWLISVCSFFFCLALAYYQLEQKQKAKDYCQKALKIQPEHANANKLLKILQQ